jgi:Contractile injection system tube protein
VTTLARATMQRLIADARGGAGSGRVPDGQPVSVQFNPASLRLTRRNNVDRTGVTTGSQKRHQPAPEAATLAFDLEFDTSEQGSPGQWVDVRRWTALVRQFVEPTTQAPKAAPPAVRFAWGTLVFDGIIDQVTEELDHFAPDGTPLRAKVAVSIAEQNPDFETGQVGPAAREAPPPPRRTPTAAPTGRGPGESGTSRTDQVVAAQAGESAQQLLARLGLDPSGWRAAMSGLQTPLTLAAGTAVQLGPEVLGGGLVTPLPAAGFAAAGAAASPQTLAAALQPGAPGAGFVLAAGGGVAAAAAAVERARAETSDAAARAAFGAPAPAGAGGQAALPPGGTTASPAPDPAADPRAGGYGRDVPLRPRPVLAPGLPGLAGQRSATTVNDARQRCGDGCCGMFTSRACANTR